MTTLLEVHDAVLKLADLTQQINGGGSDAGIMKQLCKTEWLLRSLSPVYHEEDIDGDSVFWNAVLNTDLDMNQRVKMLMGELSYKMNHLTICAKKTVVIKTCEV